MEEDIHKANSDVIIAMSPHKLNPRPDVYGPRSVCAMRRDRPNEATYAGMMPDLLHRTQSIYS